MKYKILGYLFLVVVLAVIVGGTLYWQSKHNIVLAPVIKQEQNNFKTYADPAGKYELTYPKEDLVIKPDEAGQTFFQNVKMPDLEVHVPSSVFPNTNFNESYVVVAEDGSIKNAADCKKYSNGASQLKSTDKSEKINGINFDKAEISGAAAGNLYETRLYRVFHGGTCYEISLTLHTGNIGNYPPGAVSEVNKGEAWSKLMEVLNTFKFTSEDKPAASADKVFCGGIAGIKCPTTGYICTPEGTYPDAGTNCIKVNSQQSGVLQGHVDIGPLCAGPERVDMPCTKTADYSQTQILIYLNNKAFRSADISSSGDYSIELAAGNYSVSYKSNYGMLTSPAAKSAVITAGKSTTLNFTIDTGIR